MSKISPQHGTIPPLANGDKLTRYEFERRYNAMSNLKKADLDDGIMQSRVFPGLWLAANDLLAGNMQSVLRVLHEDLQSAEHGVL
jgi:hypothetical protein